VFPDGCTDMLQLAPARCEVFGDMAAYQAVDKIDEPVDDKEPREEEMPAATRREIAMAWERHRPGKAPNIVAAVR